MLGNGTIQLSNGNWIGPTTQRTAFLKTPDGLRTSTIVNSGSWTQYLLYGVRLLDALFDVLLTFDGEVLRSVTLVRDRKSAKGARRSAQALLDEKLANDRWLKLSGRLESKSKTSWGSVESTVDYSLGSAAIVVSFASERADANKTHESAG